MELKAVHSSYESVPTDCRDGRFSRCRQSRAPCFHIQASLQLNRCPLMYLQSAIRHSSLHHQPQSHPPVLQPTLASPDLGYMHLSHQESQPLQCDIVRGPKTIIPLPPPRAGRLELRCFAQHLTGEAHHLQHLIGRSSAIGASWLPPSVGGEIL